MRLYRDRAVVLRQHKLGEADRIVTLLTRDHGLVRAVAKGVRRTRSKFGARLEPFAHIDVQLHPGRNLDIVTQVQADRRVRHRHRQRLRPLHLRVRHAGNRRTAGRGGAGPGARAAPAHRRRAAGGGRRRPPRRAGARRLSAARHGHRRLGAGADRMRPLRRAGPAPGVPRRRGRQRVRALPPGRFGDTAAGRAGPDGRAARRRLGARARRRRSRTAARPAGWWPRTCSGIWNVSCEHCRWSNGHTGSIARSPTIASRCSGRMSPWR